MIVSGRKSGSKSGHGPSFNLAKDFGPSPTKKLTRDTEKHIKLPPYRNRHVHCYGPIEKCLDPPMNGSWIDEEIIVQVEIGLMKKQVKV